MEEIISTDVDKFFKLISQKKRISQDDILNELNLNIFVIEKYAEILNKKGKIIIEYPLLKKAVYVLNENNYISNENQILNKIDNNDDNNNKDGINKKKISFFSNFFSKFKKGKKLENKDNNR
jgi:hypothetical protein